MSGGAWRSYAALGDSLTFGIGDPAPGGWRGWAGLLADSMDGMQLHNLARCGARAQDIASEQLDHALTVKPQLASVIVGMNDTLRGNFDLDQVARSMRYAVGALRRDGAIVLTARLPEPGRLLKIPGVVARPLARRASAINAVVDDIAATHGTVHLDLARHPDAYASGNWGIDRLHPSERGHRLIARLYAEQLAVLGVPVTRLPSRATASPAPSRWMQAGWLATEGTAWLARRSRDLVPTLTRLAIREWWYQRRDRIDELDEQVVAELEAILGGDGSAVRVP